VESTSTWKPPTWEELQELLDKGYFSGGYTPKTKDTDPFLAVLHGNEWVMPAWQVRQNGELLSKLETQRLRGYAKGGFTTDIQVEKQTLYEDINRKLDLFIEGLNRLNKETRNRRVDAKRLMPFSNSLTTYEKIDILNNNLESVAQM
jgi:hypothetical protein